MPTDAEYLQEFLRRRKAGVKWDSLEQLLTHRDGYGLETATPLQRAICRIVDGQPLEALEGHPHVQEAIGDVGGLSGVRPKRVVLLAGIRTFKSLFTSAVSIQASQIIDDSRLGPGEIPRFSALSVSKDLARPIQQHLVGNLLAKPSLSSLLVKEPVGDSVLLRAPSGRPVEVKVVAGAKAGSTLVARWSAGWVADEAPRMAGQEEGVINLDDARDAVSGRLLPGAQGFEVGSPWQPYGPVYDIVQEHFGQPTPDLVVIRARADWLNPYWWTPERMLAEERANPRSFRVNVLAEFSDTEESLFPSKVVENFTRQEPRELEYVPGGDYVAAIDPATRSNAWTLVIVTREGNRKRVALAKDWKGSSAVPLRPKQVLEEISHILQRYHLDWCYTDQFAAESLSDLAEIFGTQLVVENWTAKNKLAAFSSLAADMIEGKVELPNVPELRKDLLLVRKRVSHGGSVSIVLPQSSDGRHCDYAPALAMAMHRWIDEVDEDPAPLDPASAAFADWEAKQRELRAANALGRDLNKPWWDK